jgi:hypothetical protein
LPVVFPDRSDAKRLWNESGLGEKLGELRFTGDSPVALENTQGILGKGN